MIWGSLAATAKVWKRARGRSPSDDARSSLMISTAAAPSEICDDVPAVTVPVSEKAGFRPASFSSEVSRRTPSSAREQPAHVGRARDVGVHPRLERHDLVGEAALVGGPGRPLVRAQGELVHLLAGDLPAPGDLLGALALVDELEALLVERAVGLARPGLGGRPDGHPAHRLHAGPDGDVHGPRHDGLGGEVDGLLGRAALAVDRGARAPTRGTRRPGRRCGRCSWPARPTVMVQPMTTSSTREGSRSLRASRAASGWAARSVACQPERRPPRRPTGVRTASTITALGMRGQF